MSAQLHTRCLIAHNNLTNRKLHFFRGLHRPPVQLVQLRLTICAIYPTAPNFWVTLASELAFYASRSGTGCRAFSARIITLAAAIYVTITTQIEQALGQACCAPLQTNRHHVLDCDQ